MQTNSTAVKLHECRLCPQESFQNPSTSGCLLSWAGDRRPSIIFYTGIKLEKATAQAQNLSTGALEHTEGEGTEEISDSSKSWMVSGTAPSPLRFPFLSLLWSVGFRAAPLEMSHAKDKQALEVHYHETFWLKSLCTFLCVFSFSHFLYGYSHSRASIWYLCFLHRKWLIACIFPSDC